VVLRVPGSEEFVVRRPLQRWTAVILTVTLFCLTLAAVLGSWRQAVLLRAVADESARIDAYQHVSYLAEVEQTQLQAALHTPSGAGRDAALATSRQILAALRALTAHDDDQARRNQALAAQQQAAQPIVARYLELLESGDEPTAHEFLENDVEPIVDKVRFGLLAEQQQHLAHYTAEVGTAERQSSLLLAGTLVTFLVGLGVLAAVGWSKQSHRRLIEQMAAHDALTGLPNRVAFHRAATLALVAAGADGGRPTVLMLDLDGFKEVNDNLGHHCGDLLLIEVAQRLRRSVRDQDTVARLGGDEFAILLKNAGEGIGETAATRIQDAFKDPFTVDGITLDIEVSIGIVSGGPEDDVAALMRFADIAMYTAKEHRLGSSRFNPGQEHVTASRLTLLGDLRRALDNDDEIVLYYQPKIAVGTGEVIGAEALARWQHPARGLVSPADFIPVLEGTSLIHRFTARVLGLALAQARTWLDAGDRIPVAVNVSTRCLLDPAFPDTVATALQRAGLPGELLCIEITENTVMADPTRAIEVLHRIRGLGVSTAIDDFGTGYSSMAYLKILPVDEIKVDRSFVRDMATDHSNFVLVESTVDLGHNLGLTVVAEGVEDDSTAGALRDLGCDTAQGYHFARPLTAADFTDYLTRHQVGPASSPSR
jgi:diguanylate cyclase (GGDEF)-like protein